MHGQDPCNVHVFVFIQSDTPSPSTFPSSAAPQGRCPTPNPALLISAGPVAKEKTGDGEGRGTVPQPCGGQSLQISQPNLGPFPLGVCAQQALLRQPPAPQDDRGL